MSLPHHGKLAAITAYFNPAGWKSRRANYHRFVASLASSGVDLWTMEAAMDSRPFELSAGPRTVKLHCRDAIWQKERMLNLLLKYLPSDVDKVAWLDCDIVFDDSDWARHSAALLESRSVIQLFEVVQFLGPDGGPAAWHNARESLRGFVAGGGESTSHLHPGFAWAAHRALLERHTFPDFLIAGSADAIIALSAMNRLGDTHLCRYSNPTRQKLEQWSAHFSAEVQCNVGYLPGTIRHLWHGSHKNRQYLERLKDLAKLDFKPDQHLETGPEGLLQWSGTASPELRAMIELYFHERQED